MHAAARTAAEESLPLLWQAIDGLEGAQGRDHATRGAWKASEALGGARMALHHKLAHVLGGALGTPHGPTHATLLPYTLAFNLPAAPALAPATGASPLWDVGQLRLGRHAHRAHVGAATAQFVLLGERLVLRALDRGAQLV